MSKTKIIKAFRSAVSRLRDYVATEQQTALQQAERAFGELRQHDSILQSRIEQNEVELRSVRQEAQRAKTDADGLRRRVESLVQRVQSKEAEVRRLGTALAEAAPPEWPMKKMTRVYSALDAYIKAIKLLDCRRPDLAATGMIVIAQMVVLWTELLDEATAPTIVEAAARVRSELSGSVVNPIKLKAALDLLKGETGKLADQGGFDKIALAIGMMPPPSESY